MLTIVLFLKLFKLKALLLLVKLNLTVRLYKQKSITRN